MVVAVVEGLRMASIFDFFSVILQYLKSLFTGALWLLKSIPSIMGLMYDVFAYCPPFLLIFLQLSLLLTIMWAVFKLL